MSKDPIKVTEEHLRANGFMLIDEFVEKFTSGLTMYLRQNWPGDGLHHPEDLAVNAAVYAEATLIHIGNFGVANTNTNTVAK
jgi:hypothetical protein